MAASKLVSISNVKDKTGRVDVLCNGLLDKLLQVMEIKTNLPGLREGIMPIVEQEIRKNISPTKIIPKEYEKLAQLIGQRLKIG